MAWVTKDSVEQYDHTPEPPKEYTKKEKAQNWWHYHKFIVLGVVAAILVVAWFIKDTVFQTRPQDVQIGYIGQYDLPADTVTALQDALTPYCTDLNGDGKVVVQVNSYTVDFNAENDNSDAYNQMAGVTRLSADLSDNGTLYVMLIADPAGFQKSTGALAYLDGTPPEDDADDWQNMVYRWTDCPVLAGMDLGDYDGYTLLDDATGSNQSVLSTLYVGRRAVLDEEQAARLRRLAAVNRGRRWHAGAVLRQPRPNEPPQAAGRPGTAGVYQAFCPQACRPQGTAGG